MRKAGRPKIYDEPVIRKNFDFPQSFAEKLEEFSKDRRQSMTAVVISALENEMAEQEGDVREEFENVEGAVLSALRKYEKTVKSKPAAPKPPNTLTVRVSTPTLQRFKELSEEVGYAAPEHLLMELAIVVVNNPKEARALMFGEPITDDDVNKVVADAQGGESSHKVA